MKLQIHHFYDIMRDFGSGKSFEPHDYGHSYHKIANLIQQDPKIEIEIVLGCDEVCAGCKNLKNGHCLDAISHRPDFREKEMFNDHINARTMKVCGIKVGDRVTPLELCEKARLYLKNIEWIYEVNEGGNTQKRKEHVMAGIKKYLSRVA
jgi:hypothetical protein